MRRGKGGGRGLGGGGWGGRCGVLLVTISSRLQCRLNMNLHTTGSEEGGGKGVNGGGGGSKPVKS